MAKKDKYKINNIVIIGDREKRELYEHAILIRMAPHTYRDPDHGCIIINVRDSLLEFAEKIIRTMKWAGITEISRIRKELKNQRAGYTLPDAWEIKLKKRAVLEMDEEEE